MPVFTFSSQERKLEKQTRKYLRTWKVGVRPELWRKTWQWAKHHAYYREDGRPRLNEYWPSPADLAAQYLIFLAQDFAGTFPHSIKHVVRYNNKQADVALAHTPADQSSGELLPFMEEA